MFYVFIIFTLHYKKTHKLNELIFYCMIFFRVIQFSMFYVFIIIFLLELLHTHLRFLFPKVFICLLVIIQSPIF
jgi:hypothetical protein